MRLAAVAAATGLALAGGESETTPMLNHVERRPSAWRTAAPVAVDSPFAPIAVTSAARPELFASTWTSMSRPLACSALPSVAAVNANGPQSW